MRIITVSLGFAILDLLSFLITAAVSLASSGTWSVLRCTPWPLCRTASTRTPSGHWRRTCPGPSPGPWWCSRPTPPQSLKILQISSLNRTDEPRYLETRAGAGHSTRLPGCACRRRAGLPSRRWCEPAFAAGPLGLVRCRRRRTGPDKCRPKIYVYLHTSRLNIKSLIIKV